MKINWKIRFKNKTWLLTFVGAIVAFAYQLLALFGIAPKVDQQSIMAIVTTLLTLLTTIGVIIDPTTAGGNDSERALTYGKFDYTEHSAMGQGEDEGVK